MKKLRADTLDELWTHLNDIDVLNETEWTDDVTSRLREFERRILNAIRVEGWNGSENEDKIQWTFAGSLFYSIVCITTIGYGDQTPKTQIGKIATIFYSTLGIPLMYICLSNTGVVMADCLKVIYWKTCGTSSSMENGQLYLRGSQPSNVFQTRQQVPKIIQNSSLPSISRSHSTRRGISGDLR